MVLSEYLDVRNIVPLFNRPAKPPRTYNDNTLYRYGRIEHGRAGARARTDNPFRNRHYLSFGGSQAISRDRTGQERYQTQKNKIPAHSVYSAAIQINFPACMAEVRQGKYIRENSDANGKLRNWGKRTGHQEDRK